MTEAQLWLDRPGNRLLTLTARDSEGKSQSASFEVLVEGDGNTDGEDGTDGEAGSDGTDGEAGSGGTDGEAGGGGTDGEAGSDGEAGTDGTSEGSIVAPRITAFSTSPVSGDAPLEVVVSWTTSDRQGRVRGCSLDFDGDGTADKVIQDCARTTSTTHVFQNAGTFRPRITIQTYRAGTIGANSNSVEVKAPAQTPTAPPEISRFDASPASGTAPLATTFSWSIGSPGGSSLRCSLDFNGDGRFDRTITGCTSSTRTSYSFETAGSYTVTLRVTDAAGLRTTRTTKVEVSRGSEPTPTAPTIASFQATPSTGTAPLSTNFSWSIQGTRPLRCDLDFDGDGATDRTVSDCTSTSTVAQVFQTVGTRDVNLVVTDGNGLTASRKTRVQVSESTPTPEPEPEPEPNPNPGPAVGDVFISKAEWGQSVIRSDLRLLRGKDALLRLYVLGSNSNISGVEVSAEVYNGTTRVGALPLLGPSTPPTSADPANLSNQYRAIVPGNWINPGMSVRVVVDPSNRVSETNENNNGLTLQPVVEESIVLPVKMIPIAHNGLVGKVPNIQQAVMQVWPLNGVDQQVRAPYTYQGGATMDLSTAVSEMYKLRTVEGGGRYYIGLVPGMEPRGTIGVGYVGYPASVSIDHASVVLGTVAHELGHNFGRPHAPCGVTNADASYPYANATLGTWGWDYVAQKLISPSLTKDLMSYCNPSWVSDYNYLKVFDFLKANRPRATMEALVAEGATEMSVLISGTVDRDGVRLDPVHRVEAEPVVRKGEWTLIVQTDRGEESWPFAVDELADVDETVGHFAVVVPDPGAIQRIRILRDGAEVWSGGADAQLLKKEALVAPTLVESDGWLDLQWDATAHPWAAITHVGKEGRTILALSLEGGSARLPIEGLPVGGSFEISLSDGLDATRVVIER